MRDDSRFLRRQPRAAPPAEVTDGELLLAARELLRDQARSPMEISGDGPRPYDDPRISDEVLEGALVRLGALSQEPTTSAAGEDQPAMQRPEDDSGLYRT